MKSDLPESVVLSFRRGWRWLTKGLISAPTKLLRKKTDIPPSNPMPEQEPLNDVKWKEKALADFHSWLDALPETAAPLDAAGADSCDLFTLLSEFTALRQEIRMQNREQNKGISSLDRFVEQSRKFETTIESLGERNQRIADAIQALPAEFEQWEGRMQRAFEGRVENFLATRKGDIEMNAVQSFLNVRDSLIRGLQAAREVSGARTGLFRSPPRGIEGVVEGYAMAIRRFDRALYTFGIEPVDPLGKPFDPKIMRALDARPAAGGEKGLVVEVQLEGFIRGEEVIRTAEVVVSV